MILILVVIVSFLTALSNLFIRKSVDSSQGQGGDPFLIPRFLGAALVTLLVTYFSKGSVGFDKKMILLGVSSGIILGLMQWSIGMSVKYGPPGISFTFAGASCVIPPLAMFLFFGPPFGHVYSIPNGLGTTLVLLGLLWMAMTQKSQLQGKSKRELILWSFWALIAFTINACYQSFFQWRALMLKDGLPDSHLLPFHCDPEYGDCFILFMFLTAAAIQMFIPTTRSPVTLSMKDRIAYGLGGGVIMGFSSFILMRTTELAQTGSEKAVIFPMMSITLIILCNAWGRWLYQEKVNWWANALCAIGILVAL